MRIVHVSTIHRALDVRIFYKECRTLAEAGYEVHFAVPHPPADSLDRIKFHPVAGPHGQGRLEHVGSRVISSLQAYRVAKTLRADVYHLHDPDLILAGLLLKRTGAAVIYDVHEDSPQEAISLNRHEPLWGHFQSLVWKGLEQLARWTLDGFVCATPTIAKRFPPTETTLVRNFPLLSEFPPPGDDQVPYAGRPNGIFYSGGLSAVRGIAEMVQAVGLLPENAQATLVLAGEFLSPALKSQVEQLAGWKRTVFLGWQSREGIGRQLECCRVGLVLLHPTPEYLVSLPVKLFEYMAAGLPVVVSDFPLWRNIVEGARCGIVVNPLSSQEIADAILYLLDHPSEAEEMGRRGREAVVSQYNWEQEADKLTELYKRIEQS